MFGSCLVKNRYGRQGREREIRQPHGSQPRPATALASPRHRAPWHRLARAGAGHGLAVGADAFADVAYRTSSLGLADDAAADSGQEPKRASGLRWAFSLLGAEAGL
jgi:hypothetical protein